MTKLCRGKPSYGTIRKAYHQWQSERGAERVQVKAAADEQLELANFEVANDTDVAQEALVVGEETTSLLPVSDVSEGADGVSAPEIITEITGDGGDRPGEPALESGATDERAMASDDDEPQELTLEEAVECGGQSWAQHVGSWIMLAMLERMGLYRLARAADPRSATRALRIALDAVVIALCVGQKCVEGVRRLQTVTAPILLRCGGAISASWCRRLLAKLGVRAGTQFHHGLAQLLLKQSADERVVLYVDNHHRRYTGKHVIRKGWRMQDKRAVAGSSDFYVHDEEGRPLWRLDSPEHGSLSNWLRPVGRLAREALGGDTEILLAFDRGGAFAEELAALRNEGFEWVTYERKPYALLAATAFDQSLLYHWESQPHQPILIRYCETRAKNLGKGRGRVRRMALLMPDGVQINILGVSSLPADKLIQIQLRRWGRQENQFKHEVERWGINQLDGRATRPYPPDAIIPNPARRRIDRELKLLRAAEGEALRKLDTLADGDPKRIPLERDAQAARTKQQELIELRPKTPRHIKVCDSELAAVLVQHPGDHKRVIDTVRVALANAETDLAAGLAPLLPRPREAKKALANLLAAPGAVCLGRARLTVTLAPSGSAPEQAAFRLFTQQFTRMSLMLPGDPSRRPIRWLVQS